MRGAVVLLVLVACAAPRPRSAATPAQVPLPVLVAGDRDAAPAACWADPGRLYESDLAQRYDAVLLARAIVSALSRPGRYDDVLRGLASLREYRIEGNPVYLVTSIDADLGALPSGLHVTADRFAPAADAHDHHHDVFVVELRLDGAVREVDGPAARLTYSYLPAGDTRDPHRTRWRFGYIADLCAIEANDGSLVLYWRTLLES